MLYDADHLTFALQAVLEEGHSIRGAAKLYNVPYTTLCDHVKGRVPTDSTKPGPSPILSQMEERKLVDHIMYEIQSKCHQTITPPQNATTYKYLIYT